MSMPSLQPESKQKPPWGRILIILALIFILGAGSALRLVGVNWDENHHLHPDERFLSMVQSAISPVDGLSEYFDTENSSLNPENRGYTFFVYGTLPIFIIRYLGESLGQVDYNAITILGRQVSAIFDVFTILLIFFIGQRLYNKWVGLLAAAFYAFAVLPIQLSHFATVDTITNTFATLAIYAAVWVLTRPIEVLNQNPPPQESNQEDSPSEVIVDADEIEKTTLNWALIGHRLKEFAPYILFGLALGAATASKINAAVVALVLPMVELIRFTRIPQKDRPASIWPILRNLMVAAAISLLVFRIGQPYAFTGPGFFNIGINQNWWSSLQSLRAQASGDVDFPPALQWARRPLTFSGENLIKWGLGLPLGILTLLSTFGMGYAILRKKNWRQHLPIWAFTVLHFIWQSLSFVRTMRYQMLIYPTLALIAGWGLVKLWSIREDIKLGFVKIQPKFTRVFGIAMTVLILVGTAAWAFAFSRIYTQRHPRLAASAWIFQNVPGALTLEMETEEGAYQRPLSYQGGDTLRPGTSLRIPLRPFQDGVISAVTMPHILDQDQIGTLKTIQLSVYSGQASKDGLLGIAMVESDFFPLENQALGDPFIFVFNTPITVQQDALYYYQLDVVKGDEPLILSGSPTFDITKMDGETFKQTLPRFQQSVQVNQPYSMSVYLLKGGNITSVVIPYLEDQAGVPGEKILRLTLTLQNEPGVSRSAEITSAFEPGLDTRGDSYRFNLDQPLAVEANDTITVALSTDSEGTQLVPRAPAPVHESSWDDGIPYGVEGYSTYSQNNGIYRGDLNLEMYWPDDESKLQRFTTNLDLADYIFITSNRQWGTTTRVPERYPLTSQYYRNLLGCPEGEEIAWCYSVAEPGLFEGNFGFELVETFQSNPSIGPLEINTQFAEEAFTVYDHPKVLIFKRTDTFDPLKTRDILGSVDLSKVVYFTPGDADKYKSSDSTDFYAPKFNLTLPDERLKEQREGGTWSDLFNQGSLLNTSQPLAVIAMYGFITLLGWVSYPLVRLGLSGLDDRGYPLAKLAGLLLLAFIVWILASFRVPFTPRTIGIVLVGLLILCGVLIYIQRESLARDLRKNWRYFIAVELLALVAFVFFILVRLGNPDLWHPYKGGEKPMDFSYLNAVLKSTSFPPYDPWFAGGYINYYYYGFVIVGVPIKLLGIIPAIAYNIILPVWYSLLILGAFSIGWNLYKAIPRSRALQVDGRSHNKVLGTAFWVGLATAVGLGLLGNLGTVRLILQSFQKIASAGIPLEDAAFGQKITWTIQGFMQFLRGTILPLYPGDWYWYPSRVIPGEPITEFPYFTFIYGDLHAHLIAFPITLFAISWSFSAVLSKMSIQSKRKWMGGLQIAVSYILGGLVIGALRPTNTWDFYTYVILASISVLYVTIRKYRPRLKLKISGGQWIEKIGVAALSVIAFVLLAVFMYQPFAYWFGQGYTSVEFWSGSRTPLGAYFTHWGLFLFIIISWMAWETYHWMKTTPTSALEKLEPIKNWIYAALIVFGVLLLIFLALGVVVALVAIPVGLWAVVLMLRPGRTDAGRFLLFLIGTAILLTLAVELVYVPGDIGRMNTVFKFYLQAWILFAACAGVCLVWVLQSMRYWKNSLATPWQLIFFILVISAALFTLLGTTDKIRDRMATDAPNTLDGMAYMPYAYFYDMGVNMPLIEDYAGILWMQENIKGSPVILEGQAYEYRWGNRYTIYTGLPGVVGWNWHQRQQRAVLRSPVVELRVAAVNNFYTTSDLEYVEDFLDEHAIEYIVLGQLERAFYPGVGLEKFQENEGILWDEVFDYGDTIIYKVTN